MFDELTVTQALVSPFPEGALPELTNRKEIALAMRASAADAAETLLALLRERYE